MFFGLFGGRATTDDSLEHIEMNAMLTNVRNSVELQLRQRQSSRFMDQWEENDELLAQVRSLSTQVKTAEERVSLLEKERANLLTTALNLAVDRRALELAVARTGHEGAVAQAKPLFVEHLLKDNQYIDSTRSQVEACAKRPWKAGIAGAARS